MPQGRNERYWVVYDLARAGAGDEGVTHQTILVEGNINDTWTSMRYLIERLGPLRVRAGAPAVRLDLRNLRYLGPDGAAMLAGTIVEARQHGRDVDVEPPASASEPLLAFLEFSGFNHVVFGRPAPDPGHPKSVTVPLRVFRQSRHDDPGPIIKLIERFEPVSEDLQFALEVAVNECIQNIEDHSRSPIGGMGCARFMTQAREVRVALVDWGDGILTSLKRRYPDTSSDVQALQRVLYGGYSALSRPNNLGRGIDNLRSVVTYAGGAFFIATGAGIAEIQQNSEPKYHTLKHAFQGTIVCFTLPTGRDA